MPGRRTRLLLLVLTAIAGVVLAHTADYLALLPNGADRARHLAATGHGYWTQAVVLAVMAGLTALVLAVRRGWRAAVAPAAQQIWVPPLPVLAAGQVALFSAMEVLERVGAGISPATLLHSPEFFLGLALQLGVAAAAVLVLGAIQRAAAEVASAARRRGSLPRTPSAVITLPTQRLPRTLHHLQVQARAPPALR